MARRDSFSVDFRRHFITGLAVLIPFAITFWLMRTLFLILIGIGKPIVEWFTRTLNAAANRLDPPQPLRATGSTLARLLREVSEFIGRDTFLDITSLLAMLLVIYLLGWLANRVLGQRMLRFLQRLIDRIPLVKTIYGATRQLLEIFQTKPDGVQRVVLIEFPHEHAKVVGLVTRTFRDSRTGREVAAVFIPTTPNPTSGYLEIVPVDRVVSTDWTIDEAMTFVVSGGAVAPANLHYDLPASDSVER
jgi:uncharacterized membrane protein